jgi:hypothetical protein
MDPEDSLSCSQESSTSLYPDPGESNLYPPFYFSKIS